MMMMLFLIYHIDRIGEKKMLKGQIREIKQDIEKLEQGIYLKVWVPKPKNTFTEGETEKDVQERIEMFKHLHSGEIEFQYIEDKKK